MTLDSGYDISDAVVNDEEEFSSIGTPIDTLKELEREQSDNLQFPCLVFNDVATVPELTFLKNLSGDTASAVSLFVKKGQVVRKIGTIQVTLDNLMLISFVKKYDIDFYRSDGSHDKFDLSNPDLLMKTIHIF